MSDTAHRLISVDDYLAFENASTTRHEYLGGVIRDMVGGTHAHNQISGRFYRAVAPVAEAAGCYAYINDMKLRVGDALYYPDVFVSGEAPVNDLVQTSAYLVVEVLSPSTARIDRREKLAAYLSLPSLRMYLIAQPATPEIEVHERTVDGWMTNLAGPGDRVHVPHPSITLDIDELYRGLLD